MRGFDADGDVDAGPPDAAREGLGDASVGSGAAGVDGRRRARRERTRGSRRAPRRVGGGRRERAEDPTSGGRASSVIGTASCTRARSAGSRARRRSSSSPRTTSARASRHALEVAQIAGGHRAGRRAQRRARRGHRARPRLRPRARGARERGRVRPLRARRVRPRAVGGDGEPGGAQPVRRDARRDREPLVVAPAPSTPEGEVVSWADRIGYVCHDFEDAVGAGIVAPSMLPAWSSERCGARERAARRLHRRDGGHDPRDRRRRHGRGARRGARGVPRVQLRAHLPARGVRRAGRGRRRRAPCASSSTSPRTPTRSRAPTAPTPTSRTPPSATWPA